MFSISKDFLKSFWIFFASLLKNNVFITDSMDILSRITNNEIYKSILYKTIQNIISTIANKETSAKVKIIIDILNYKKKRRNSLEILAKKVEKTVIKSGKPYRLEPMNAYERKIIHTALQESSEVTTNSVGEEPYRRVIVRKK